MKQVRPGDGMHQLFSKTCLKNRQRPLPNTVAVGVAKYVILQLTSIPVLCAIEDSRQLFRVMSRQLMKLLLAGVFVRVIWLQGFLERSLFCDGNRAKIKQCMHFY